VPFLCGFEPVSVIGDVVHAEAEAPADIHRDEPRLAVKGDGADVLDVVGGAGEGEEWRCRSWLGLSVQIRA